MSILSNHNYKSSHYNDITLYDHLKERLTFLEDAEVRGVLDLLSLSGPANLQRRASPYPALQNHHLALGRLGILQQLQAEELHHRGRWESERSVIGERRGRGRGRGEDEEEVSGERDGQEKRGSPPLQCEKRG